MNRQDPPPIHWGKEIFRAHDEYGPMRVFDDGNKRYLAFDSRNEQSCAHKNFPTRLMHEYACAMLLPLLFLQPRHITLFGLGGGTLASCLFQLLPDTQLHVVELRPRIVEIARRFFQLPDDPRLKIEVMDAGDYLTNAAPGSTDLLLSDMYFADIMDAQQQQTRFLESCHQILSPQGWLALNYSDRAECTETAMNVFMQRFAEVRCCSVPSGNEVIFAGRSIIPHTERELMDRCKSLNNQLGFPVTRFVKRWGRLARNGI